MTASWRRQADLEVIRDRREQPRDHQALHADGEGTERER